MIDDVTTAATIASLREEVANLRVRLERSETVLESTRQSIYAACAGSGCLNSHELRVALDTARERAVVLAEEVRVSRFVTPTHDATAVRFINTGRTQHGGDRGDPIMQLLAARAETDRTNALDAAKFGGAKLARNQPCGCVVCVCEDEEKCHGCGAKHCGKHEVGDIPNPKFGGAT